MHGGRVAVCSGGLSCVVAGGVLARLLGVILCRPSDDGWGALCRHGALSRRSQSMRAKAYGSVLFSASNLNLFMGFCRKDIWIRTD